MSTELTDPVARFGKRLNTATLIEGIIAVIFGICAIAFTGGTVHTLVILFGVFCLLDGISTLMVGFLPIPGHGWLLFEGILGIVAALVAFRYPSESAAGVLIFVALWALSIGAMQLVGSFPLRKVGLPKSATALLVSGILCLVFGVLSLIDPFTSVYAIVWALGIWAVLFGAATIVRAVQTRRALS